jgi:CheY-like chemotaxis protein
MEGSDGGGKRLLVVDDEPAMHNCYCRSFAAVGDGAALGAMAADLFGAGPRGCEDPAVTLTHCHKRLDAVAQVERALAAGAPYSVAFLDVPMPPGIDSRETARRIRALDPAINLVGKAFRCWR